MLTTVSVWQSAITDYIARLKFCLSRSWISFTCTMAHFRSHAPLCAHSAAAFGKFLFFTIPVLPKYPTYPHESNKNGSCGQRTVHLFKKPDTAPLSFILT